MARPDFGESVVFHEGVELTCAFAAPGLTMEDLMRIYHEAEKELKPGDELSGNPSKWPAHRGVWAVKEAILTALYGE